MTPLSHTQTSVACAGGVLLLMPGRVALCELMLVARLLLCCDAAHEHRPVHTHVWELHAGWQLGFGVKQLLLAEGGHGHGDAL